MKIEDLEKEIYARQMILAKAIHFYEESKDLNRPRLKKEKTFADNHSFIRQTRYAYWVIAILELNKLYGKKNDSYTLLKLLNALENTYRTNWKEKLPLEKISQWKTKLEKKEIIKSKNKIQSLRDKYYAHSDKNPEKEIHEFTPEFSEVDELVTLAKNIISDIASKLLDADIDFRIHQKERAKDILNQLLALEDQRLFELKTKLEIGRSKKPRN